jgi:hypothetical protein
MNLHSLVHWQFFLEFKIHVVVLFRRILGLRQALD